MKSDIVIGDGRLEMTRSFAYPRQAVFDAWTQPDKIEKWWGCANTERVSSTVDLRQGGAFEHVMLIKGAGEYTYRGTYVELVVPEKIVTESYFDPNGEGPAATVTVEFFEEGEGTRLKLVQVGFPPMPNMEDIVSEGFSAALEKLERMLAA